MSGAAVGTFSVPRYDVRIVVTYLILLALLLFATWRAITSTARIRTGEPEAPRTVPASGAPTTSGAADAACDGPSSGPCHGRVASAVALVAAGLLTLAVPAFSYVPAPQAAQLRAVLAAGAVLAAAVLLTPWRHAPGAAVTVAAACYAATAAAAIRWDPAPRIDVWYTLQGAADGLLRGQDAYRQVWVGPPGRMAAFTYLPGTAVLLAPGRWLVGDVRWALVLVTLCTAAALWALPRRMVPMRPGLPPAMTAGDGERRAGAVAAALLLLLPGTLTQVEQAWTEPLLLACLAGWVLARSRGRGALAVGLLALALASKQHVALLLPVLAAWHRFGVRRAAAAALGAGVIVLPWFVADPGAMWHDTVRLLVDFPPLRFADTAYIAVLNEWGVRPPFWLTGALVLVTIIGAAAAVRRYDPAPGALLLACATVLFVANLVNKQAFYNQYWLVAGLVLLAWASASAPSSRRPPLPAPPP